MRRTSTTRPCRTPAAGRSRRRSFGGSAPTVAASSRPGACGRRAQPQAPGSRLINFLRGSWRELQRVQWPDRRQVMQATGVVLGFVIVAGVFLGVADFVASKLVNFITLSRRLSHPTREHVPLVRRQHIFRSREQGQAQPRAPRRVARPAARRAPDRRPDRVGVRDEGQPEDHRREAHDARLRARQHGPQRGLLVAGQGHAGRHRLRRRLQRAGAADPGRGRPPAASGDRRAPAQPRAVLDRRVGQGRLRPAVGLLGRDLRGQRGRRSGSRCWCRSSAARRRSRSASTRSRRSSGSSAAMAKKVLTQIKLQAVGGQASPAPPVGPALGQHGVNIMEFVKAFNAQTQADSGHRDPGRDHGLRGPLVHVHHQEPAGRRADQAGARRSTRARPSRTATRSRRITRGPAARRSPRRR